MPFALEDFDSNFVSILGEEEDAILTNVARDVICYPSRMKDGRWQMVVVVEFYPLLVSDALSQRVLEGTWRTR